LCESTTLKSAPKSDGGVHDCCREDDSYDEKHGPRAAKMIEGLGGTLLKDLTDEQFKLLQEACRLHTSKMATKKGKKIAARNLRKRGSYY